MTDAINVDLQLEQWREAEFVTLRRNGNFMSLNWRWELDSSVEQ